MEIYGSYVIGAICKDGILIGSDARFTFSKEKINIPNENIIATYDGVQKVFQLANLAIGVTGTSINEGKFFYYYLSDFVYFNKSKDPKQTVFDLFDFLRRNAPAIASNMAIIAAFYINEIPYLKIIDNTGKWAEIKSGIIQIGPPDTTSRKIEHSENYSCRKMIKILEKEIEGYAEINHTVGGAVSILRISKGNMFQWVKNNPRKEPYWNICELSNDFREGKAEINVRDSANLDELEKYLAKACSQV